MKDIPMKDRERIREELISSYEEFKRQMNAKGIAVVEKILRDEKEKEGEIKRIVVRK
jgi:hypothetical protein